MKQFALIASLWLSSPLLAVFFLLIPSHVLAALYAPGETLDPSCAPNDADCGVTTSSIAVGTAGQIPYYNVDGSALTATSSISILQNGNVGIGTTAPSANLSVVGTTNFSSVDKTSVSGRPVTYGVTASVAPTSLGTGGLDYHVFDIDESTSGGNNNFDSLKRLYPLEVRGEFYGAASTLGRIVTGYFLATNQSSGTVADATNLRLNVGNYSTGIIQLYKAIDIELPTNTGGGTITNAYGLYIGNAFNVGTSNNWGIYSLANYNQVGGNPGSVTSVSNDIKAALEVGSASTTGSSLFINTQSLNSILSTGLGVDGTYNSLNSNVRLKAWGVQSGGGYNSSLSFVTTFQTTEREAMRIISSGNVGIGTTTPYSKLEVWGSDTASTSAFAVVNSASTTAFAVYDNGNATYSGSIFQSSDQRLKTDIDSLDASTSLAAIMNLNPVSYTRIDQPDSGTSLGFLAQEVQRIFPSLVTVTSPTKLTPNGTLTLNYVGLIAPMVEAMQAVAAEVDGFATSFTSRFIHGDTVETNNLCVGDTCITETQFKAMLQKSGEESAPAPLAPGRGSSDDASSPDATSTDISSDSDTDAPTAVPAPPAEGSPNP